MKINKLVDVDLNILSPQKHIRIHEGDVDSVDILIGVSVDDETVDLDGITIKYDATINNYLAEQDADGSVVDDKISIPVTQNMTAMSGLLLIDVRMIQSDQILFTQTICATVEKAVVNGSTYIDLNKITIIQRMNALEEKMDYIEELVENFDTSKLIVSTNRPPSGAPAELDVDLLRVGDTWILSGASIVYKLVEAQYNYQPVSSAEPYHKFTWQPLNERYGVGNTEPPTTVTYQAVIYTINEVQWSWLPVPEYSRGDHYQMLVDGESTYYICKSGTMASTGVCTYIWREEGGGASSGITIINTETVPESAEWGDSIPASYAGNTGKAGEIAYWEGDGYFWGLFNVATDPITGNINYNWVRQADEIDISDLKASIATKMKLAPLNPTAEQIDALPAGQLYSDTTNHKAVIKGGQEFYDTVYIDENTYTKTEIDNIIGAISTLSFEVVQSKPVSDIKTNVIYLVPKSTAETNNVYEEWIYVNNAWELIGSTEIDLSNFYTKLEVDVLLAKKQIRFENPYQATNIAENDVFYCDDRLLIYDDFRYTVYPLTNRIIGGTASLPDPPNTQDVYVGGVKMVQNYFKGDYFCPYHTDLDLGQALICTEANQDYQNNVYRYTWKPTRYNATTLEGYGITDVYTKTEINEMIGDIETLLSQV